MGWFNRLKSGHHYTMMGVKATIERDEAVKKLNELRVVIGGLEESRAEGARGHPEPLMAPILSALKRTIASYKETYAAYEAAVRACQAVSDSVDAACKNADFETCGYRLGESDSRCFFGQSSRRSGDRCSQRNETSNPRFGDRPLTSQQIAKDG